MPWLPPGNRRLHSSNRGKYSNLLQRCSSLLGWFHVASVVIDKEGSAVAISIEPANDPGFHVPQHRFLFWQWETQTPETTRRMVCRASLVYSALHQPHHSIRQIQDQFKTEDRHVHEVFVWREKIMQARYHPFLLHGNIFQYFRWKRVVFILLPTKVINFFFSNFYGVLVQTSPHTRG